MKRSARRATSPKSRQKSARRKSASAPTRRKKMGPVQTAVRGVVAGTVAAIADRMPWAPDEPDALTLLELDHRRFEELLKEGEATTERAVRGRTDLLATITSELNVHELIEETVLYPVLKGHPEAKDIVLEGYQEHHAADLLMGELHELAKDDERWGAKFKVLKESLEHHIQEEEGEMFRTARAVISRADLHAMGRQMAAIKREVAEGR